MASISGLEPGGSDWRSFFRKIFPSHEVLCVGSAALAVGSAAQAWWQFHGVSRSLTAIRSARETTISELTRTHRRDSSICASRSVLKDSSGSSSNSSSSAGLKWLLSEGTLKEEGSPESSQQQQALHTGEQTGYADPHSLVVVRGSVSWWLPGSSLVPNHGEKLPCAVVESSIMTLYKGVLPVVGCAVRPGQVNTVRTYLPFTLADSSHPSASRIDISLDGATQPLPLDTVYSYLQKAEPSWGDTILHVLVGARIPVGLRMDERVLPINREVTVVGHVRRGSDGHPAMFASHGFPYFITVETKAAMIRSLRRQRGALLGWCLLLSAFAAGLVGFVAWSILSTSAAPAAAPHSISEVESLAFGHCRSLEAVATLLKQFLAGPSAIGFGGVCIKWEWGWPGGKPGGEELEGKNFVQPLGDVS